MPVTKLLIANRGEIAVRIARAAADLELPCVAVFSEDDAGAGHLRHADASRPLPGTGPAAYLNPAALMEAARSAGCDAVHPGYGFLSENAGFARACREAGLVFVGPEPEHLELFGDKMRARALALEHGVPVLTGSSGPASLTDARQLLMDGPIILKAVAGGGGRGTRIVRRPEELEPAFERCSSEARLAFGNGALYAERLLERARHVEVQIVGDGERITHFHERECSVQRRRQKLIEIAPAPELSPALREPLIEAAVKLARAVRYRSLGTFEFLVDTRAGAFYFLETNPRVQVEHTVTEAACGVDLVQLQLRLAGGESLNAAGFEDAGPKPSGYAVQLRINTETMDVSGEARPAGDVTLARFDLPGGPGVRVDTAARQGDSTNGNFDSLLAKLIVHHRGTFARTVDRLRRSLAELQVSATDGRPCSNANFLAAILARPEFVQYDLDTGFVDDHVEELVAATPGATPEGGTATAASPTNSLAAPPGTEAIASPMRGRLIEVSVSPGENVSRGAQLAVLEAMKMEHVIQAPCAGFVERLFASAGDAVSDGQPLLFLRPGADDGPEAGDENEAADLNAIRPDLQEVIDRHFAISDEGRPRAAAKRHKRGQRTARENLADLCDPGTFKEYGAMALAAQRSRRSLDDLIRLSPADGLVAGLAAVNGDRFQEERSRCAVMSYDYTVFAGTQGMMNHKKTDRLLQVVEELQLPMVVFTEGGGGRPGDVDAVAVGALDLHTFTAYAKLSGLVPRIAVASGRCFAGNAAFFGASDITIATQDATIGMGGPVMIQGAGLGRIDAEDVGPAAMHARSGVVDVLVRDEVEAVRAAKHALSFFQGPLQNYEHADQRLLRTAVPDNRLRAYDVRRIIRLLADTDSMLELRPLFAPGMITALIRIGGRPLGLIANHPGYLAGAIDADGADKAARFLQLCDAFALPVLSLVDTPGIMVGADAERTALVRHAARLFLTGASVNIPIFAIVLRKGYGLGAMAMTGGSFHRSIFTAAWPSGEFGAMGLEGAVSVGFQKELAEIKDWDQRDARFRELVEEAYQHGKALNMASYLEIDAVIDPAESREWVLRGLASLPPTTYSPQEYKKRRPCVDSW